MEASPQVKVEGLVIEQEEEEVRSHLEKNLEDNEEEEDDQEGSREPDKKKAKKSKNSTHNKPVVLEERVKKHYSTFGVVYFHTFFLLMF